MDDNTLYKLNNWLFDPLEKSLVSYNDGPGGEVMFERLEAMHASLLFHLVQRNGGVLRRDEMVSKVWESKYVDDRTINATVSRLRKILAQQPGNFIKTHPKLGYSFSEPIEIIPRQKPEAILVEHNEPKTLHKLLVPSIVAGLALTISTGIAIWHFLEDHKEIVDVHVKDTAIAPATFLPGHSHSPSISPDGNRIAFVNWPEEESVSTVVVQCLGSNKTFHIDPSREAGSPVWSPSGSHLYYQSYENNQCSINKVAIADDFTMGETEELASCGSIPFFRNIAISEDEQHLYYTHANDSFEPLVITKLDLSSKQKTAITVSLQQHQGDENVSLSPNGQYIAYNRALDDGNMNIMVTDLNTGEAKQLLTVPYLNSKISWHKDNETIYIADKNQDVKSIDIHTGDSVLVAHFSKGVTSPVFDENTQRFLASYGNKTKVNVEFLSIEDNKISQTKTLKSAFNDFNASMMYQTKAFVSNRSGSDQVWLQNDEGTFQITKFDNALGADNLELSYDLSSLLYIHDAQPYVVDFGSGFKISTLALGNHVKNLRWQCNSSQEVLYIDHVGVSSALIKYNLSTKEKTRLSNGVTSFNQDCDNEAYYASFERKPGIYKLDASYSASSGEVFFAHETFISADYWGANSNGLYYMSHYNELTLHSFDNQHDKMVFPDDMWANRIRITGNSLVIDSVSLEQTFIGEFKGE